MEVDTGAVYIYNIGENIQRDISKCILLAKSDIYYYLHRKSWCYTEKTNLLF